MGFIDDILKGLPANATLREKNASLESENASLDQEIAILKDQLREAKGEIAKLQKRIEELTHIELAENDIRLLKLVAVDPDLSSPSLAQITGWHIQLVQHHIDRLMDVGFLDLSGSRCQLTKPGRAYLVKNDLL